MIRWKFIVLAAPAMACGCGQQPPAPATTPPGPAPLTAGGYDRRAVDAARAFTAKIAAGDMDAAVGDHVDAEEMFRRTFPDRTGEADIAEGGRLIAEIVKAALKDAHTANPRFDGFTRGEPRTDGLLIVKYNARYGTDDADQEVLAFKTVGPTAMIVDFGVTPAMSMTDYLRNIQQMSGEDPLAMLRGLAGAVARIEPPARQ